MRWTLLAPLLAVAFGPPTARLRADAATPVGQAAAASADAGPCLRWHTEARLRAYGYSHVVLIDNGCDERYACTVSTDVNRAPETVTVEAHTQAEVVTFLESPARTFQATVDCQAKS